MTSLIRSLIFRGRVYLVDHVSFELGCRIDFISWVKVVVLDPLVRLYIEIDLCSEIRIEPWAPSILLS